MSLEQQFAKVAKKVNDKSVILEDYEQSDSEGKEKLFNLLLEAYFQQKESTEYFARKYFKID